MFRKLLLTVILAVMKLLLILSTLSAPLLVCCAFFFNHISFCDTERKQHLTHLNRMLNNGQEARCLKMRYWTQENRNRFQMYIPPAIVNTCKPTEIHADYINGAWEVDIKIYMANG